MAKQNGQTLVKASEPQPLAVPENLQGGLQIAGDTDKTPKIGRLVCYQGTQTEDKKYGAPKDTGFSRGDYLDPLERRSLGDKVNVMPIGGWMEWVYWPKDAKLPIYRHTDRSQVPPGDLLFEGDQPPKAMACACIVVAVEGEPWPYVFVFKGTSWGAWEQTIKPFEGRRASLKKGPGMYTLSTRDDKNAKNQDYKRVTAKPAGDPTAAMLELGSVVRSTITNVQAAAKQAVEEDVAEGAANPDCPI